MVKKLKIPSVNLMIIGNHVYKGYRAEYKERLRQGEFLVVVLKSNGQLTHVPIQNIVFIMDDGRLFKYILDQNEGLTLVEYGTGKEVKNVPSIPEIISNNKISPIMDTELEKQSSESRKDSMEEDGQEEEITYLDSFEGVKNANREMVILESNKFSKNLEIIFNLLGFEMDTPSINYHSNYLKDILENPFFKNITFNSELYKTYALAYVFIYINQMGIGYPIIVSGCRLSSNDDPSYITCVASKTNFIKVDPKQFNIDQQIVHLLNSMGTRLVPAPQDLGLSNKFSMLKMKKPFDNKKISPVIKTRDIKPKMMTQFPRMTKDVSNAIKDQVKNYIKKKLQKNIKKEGDLTVQNILEHFNNNFESYIKGPNFTRINNNKELLESKVIIPYIKEYIERVDLEEKNFYKKPIKKTSKTTLKKKTAPVKKTQELKTNFKKYIIPRVNASIKQILENPEISRIEKNALNYVLNNIENVINYNQSQLKSLQLDLLTADEQQTETIKSMLWYNDYYKKLVKAMMTRKEDIDMEKAKKDIKNTTEISRATRKIKI